MTTEPIPPIDIDLEAAERQRSSELQERLYATTDAMVWADEFCKQFEGHWIRHSGSDDPAAVDPGTMVGWFANYWGVITQKFASQPIHRGTWYAFLHFYHQDCANAAFHCANPRYSPITFRLAEFIRSTTTPVTAHPEGGPAVARAWDDPRLQRVWTDLGQYEEDPGR
jgi:hypothetical protein